MGLAAARIDVLALRVGLDICCRKRDCFLFHSFMIFKYKCNTANLAVLLVVEPSFDIILYMLSTLRGGMAGGPLVLVHHLILMAVFADDQ